MHQHMVQCSGMKSDSILTLQINRRMEFVFASHSFDAWESWAIEGPLEECRLIDQPGCSLSKKELGIIHMVAGLGFEWALNPILSCGVSINFRDINGWTALHWAARFGR